MTDEKRRVLAFLFENGKQQNNYYARIERGEENPSYEVLEKIIKALKVKSSEVFPF